MSMLERYALNVLLVASDACTLRMLLSCVKNSLLTHAHLV